MNSPIFRALAAILLTLMLAACSGTVDLGSIGRQLGRSQDLASLGVQAITMINGTRQPIAVPSVIGSDGASFAVTRTQNPSAGAAGTQRRRRG